VSGRRPGRRAAGVLGLLAAAEFMLTLDLSIVNVALPAVRASLGFSPGALAWVVNGYALAFGGFLLLGGRAADLAGGRRVFLAALSVFSAASLACGLATGPAVLVAARAVQGLSAGILSPATLSILTAAYRDSGERRRALSAWTAVAIGGGAAGALLGGVLTSALSWRWIFFVNVPAGALLVALAARRLPRDEPRAGRGPRLDLAGAVTVTGGLTALVWALIQAGASGWGAGQVAGGLGVAAAALAAFAVIETRVARAPLVPFGAFRSRPLAAGNLTSFLSFAPVTATWFFLTLYLQGSRGYSAVQAGLLFLPMSLAVIAGSQLSFRLVARIDSRLLFASGGLVAAAGLAGLARLSAATSVTWLAVSACLAMIGGGLMFAPSTVAATSAGGPAPDGLASGLLNTARQLGGAVGLAVLSAVAAAGAGPRQGIPHAAATGYGPAFAAGAAIYLATALVGVLALPARLTPPAAGRDAPRQACDRASGRPGGGSGTAAVAADLRSRGRRSSPPPLRAAGNAGSAARGRGPLGTRPPRSATSTSERAVR
jgi:EmrB/QacA subfamily drug resistance transporter